MRKCLIAVSAVALLAACVTAPTPQELAAEDNMKCGLYGMPEGHPDHGGCMMALDLRRQDAAAAAEAARLANPGLPLAGAALLGQAFYPPAPAVPNYAPVPHMCGRAYAGGPVIC